MKEVLKILIIICVETFWIIPAKSQNDYSDIVRAKALSLQNQCEKIDYQLLEFNESDPLIVMEAKANILMQCAKYDQAINLFTRINSYNPKKCLYQLAACYAMQNADEKSIEYLQLYLSTPDKLRPSKIKLNPYFQRLSQTKLWEQLWSQEWYSKYELMLSDAWFEFENQNYIQAIELIEKIIEKKPNMHQAYYLRSLISAANGKYKTAVDDISKAIKINPKNSDYYLARGNYYLEILKPAKAVDDFELLKKYDPVDADYYMLTSKALYQWGKYDAATEKIEVYLSLFPSQVKALSLAADIYLKNENMLKAMEMLGKAIQTDKYNSALYITRGKVFFNSAAYEYAEKDFTMAMDFEPYNAELYYLRGLCRVELKKRKEACIDFAKARKYGRTKTDDELRKYCYDCLEEIQKAAGL